MFTKNFIFISVFETFLLNIGMCNKNKDITEKTLESYNDVFADIVNVLLFDGKNVVLEEDLETDTTFSQLKVDGEIHQQERDVAKIWKNGKIRLSIIGFENQTCQDYKMPLRIISYDGASYKQQLLNKQNDYYYPVVSIVLYFGTKKHWTAPKCLSKCLKIPEKLEQFVSDYKINVFEIAWLSEEKINMFRSDFKIVAEYFHVKRLKKEYEGSKDTIKHVDEILKTLSALTGDNSFETVYNKLNHGDGGTNMCEVVQKIIEKGRTEGRLAGKLEEQSIIIRNLIESNAGSIEQIAAWTKLPVNDVQKIAETVTVRG